MSTLRDAGVEIDAEAAHDAFWAAVQMCETKPEEMKLSPEVPRLLRHVFESDLLELRKREKLATNVTCQQPAEDGEGVNVIDQALLDVSLCPGRACSGGVCCEACSRVTFPIFATRAECEAFLEELQYAITPPLHQFSIQKCAFRDMRTTLIFVRLVERMRRVIAHEYGLDLQTVTPLQTFVSCFVGAQDKQGGLHSDESTHAEFHYSCVLYLSTQHMDFEGGTFNFNDPSEVVGGDRVLTPLSPSRGAAVIFSSGWENMHEVEPLVSGTRFAVPSFFGTHPARPEDEFAPGDDDVVADELWRTLLSPEETADFRQFMLRWHALLAAPWR